MRKKLVSGLLFLVSGWCAAQSSASDPDSITFGIRIGAYTKPNDTLKEKMESSNYDFKVFYRIKLDSAKGIYFYEMINLPCIEEAEIFKEQFVKEGYKDTFIIAFDKQKRISVEDAIARTIGKCK